MKPHFRTDAQAAATFDRLAERNIAAAVRAAIHAGFSVKDGDVETPTLDALEAMPKAARGDYQMRAANQIANERQALQLLKSQETIHRALDAAKDEARSDERVAFVNQRAAEIEAAYFADLRAGFRADAEREAAARFDGVTAITKPITKALKRA